MTSGNKWNTEHELLLSREWWDLLPPWRLRKNHPCWTYHHKVSTTANLHYGHMKTSARKVVSGVEAKILIYFPNKVKQRKSEIFLLCNGVKPRVKCCKNNIMLDTVWYMFTFSFLIILDIIKFWFLFLQVSWRSSVNWTVVCHQRSLRISVWRPIETTL